MKTFNSLLRLVLSMVFCAVLGVGVSAQTTAFIYQGSLKDGSTAANGNYDFQFALYDAVSGGNQLGSTLSRTVAVANGIFSVSLDFGSQFPGANRFLEIRVKLSGGGTLTTLTPRQSVNSAPYAVKSLNADTVGGTAASGFIQNGTTLQTANQNISGNAFFGGQVGIGTTNVALPKLTVLGSGSVDAILGSSSGGVGITGSSTSNYGVFGSSNTNLGVYGDSVNNIGVFGHSTNGVGVSGQSLNGLAGDFSGRVNISGAVAIGTATPLANVKLDVESGSNAGILGRSTTSEGVIGFSGSADGVAGQSTSGTGVSGFSDSGRGVYGSSSTQEGVVGVSSSGNGVFGITSNGFGVYGFSTSSVGVLGESQSGMGVYGKSSAVGATVAGVRGVNLASGGNGVIGEAGGGNGTGVYGVSTSATGYGVVGRDLNGTGVYGESSIGTGVYGTSNIGSLTTAGVFGTNTASGGIAVIGQANSGPATGVFGVSTSSTGFGMYARNSSGGTALFADGPVVLGTLGAAGGTSLCRNASNQIANCSSSLRYKKNIESFDQGLSLLYKLRPITFDWKSNGMHDLGFGAEDVEKAEPLLVTYNDKGQVEGVKYDRIGVVLINAVKEQQAQIETQKKMIDSQQNEVSEQKAVNQRLQSEIDELKRVVCTLTPDAEICTEKEK